MNEERYIIRPYYYMCPICGATHGRPFGETKDRPIRRCKKCFKVVKMEIVELKEGENTMWGDNHA